VWLAHATEDGGEPGLETARGKGGRARERRVERTTLLGRPVEERLDGRAPGGEQRLVVDRGERGAAGVLQV
jgi:hypothetical protein